MSKSDTRRGRSLLPYEEWARQIISRELGRPVSAHDDGTSPAMYDLCVGQLPRPEIAIECVGAVNHKFTETWNIGPARGPVDTTLQGDWLVDHGVGTDVRTVRREIGDALAELDDAGELSFPVDYRLRRSRPHLHSRLQRLGIEFVSCYRYPGSGKVSFTMPGWGGGVDESGRAVPDWISAFLGDPKRNAKLDKLAASGADECHVFVAVSIAGVPWSVESYLTSEMAVAPLEPCDLPSPVDAVWICPTHGSKGLLWSSSGWQLFPLRSDAKPGGA